MQKEKVAQQWKALHRSNSQKRTIEVLQLLERDPLKKKLMNIEN